MYENMPGIYIFTAVENSANSLILVIYLILLNNYRFL